MKNTKLSQFFKDETGQYSALRLAFLFIIFSVLSVWIWSCLQAGKMVPIETSVLYLVGAAFTGKVGQSFSENFSPNNTSNPPKIP